MSLSLRPITADDAEVLVDLIADLNRHFQVDLGAIDANLLHSLLSETPPFLSGFLLQDMSGPHGYALCQRFLDTDTGTMGSWLLDLYVDPKYRGQGWGRRLLSAVAQDALSHGSRCVSWAVYADNRARHLYDSIGAGMDDEALLYELRDSALTALADEASEGNNVL